MLGGLWQELNYESSLFTLKFNIISQPHSITSVPVLLRFHNDLLLARMKRET